jgi:hypothetical protein
MFFHTFAPANTALCTFSIRFWRHVAIAIGLYHIGDNFSSLTSPESGTSMTQFALVASACYTDQIDGTWYAVDMKLHLTPTPRQQMVFEDVCRQWHVIFKWQSLVVRPLGTVAHQQSPLLESTLSEMVHRVFTDVSAALKSLFGFQEFKSQTLEFAMLSVISRSENLLIVAPTGFGKSMLFYLPYAIDSDRTTVVFAPLKALKHQIARSPPKAITPVVWNKGTDIPSDRPRLILYGPKMRRISG